MPEMFIGLDYEGVPCLKITRDSADNAATTPDSEREKFAYNSKDGALAEIVDITLPVSGASLDPAEWSAPVTFNLNGGPVSRVYFSPPTSNEYTYERATERQVLSGTELSYGFTYYSTRYFDNLAYDCPMMSDVCRLTASGRYANVATWNSDFYIITSATLEVGEVEVDNYTSRVGSPAFQIFPANAVVATGAMRCRVPLFSHPMVIRDIASVTHGSIARQLPGDPRYDQSQVVWNLPGDDTPLAIADPITGTEGVPAISITPTEFKIARQGHDVDTATFEQLVFAASRRPAKIIAAGDVSVPAHSTYDIECGVTLNDTIAVEQAVYKSTITFPFPYNLHIDDAWNFEYTISGSTVTLYNDTGSNFRVRYMVLATDAERPTTGTNDVLRKINIDGEDVFQILRPGAGPTPNLADIVIDSRWPSIPILKEGFIDVDIGDEEYNVTFDNPRGLFPFVKFTVYCDGPSGMYFARSPIVRKRINNTGSDFARLGGDTTYCTLRSSTQIRFYTFRGRIIEYRPGSGTIKNDPYPVVGLRYYVFGIPT
ncbi:hypothetical protein E2A64_10365 [Pseudohoeflea suaedae]|uniref:Uncharacterized protein n=1 Tax=Pseudohoeflea suaedae TaxID=877384 RepID=A0A4R5PJA0_9HYPH|nr:hypothetical protein [Pseudohoeflea suaedae]TDH35731.1 hypothetical protein E2A64_10365 [Pseudohoeflea suaedae]